MFSPSLVSMMLHSFWSDVDEAQEIVQYSDYNAVARALGDLLSRYSSKQGPGVRWPEIPMVGRSKNVTRLRDALSPSILVGEFAGPDVFVWGRIPVNLLVAYLSEHHATPRDEEFLDLGTPLQEHMATSTIEQACADLMAKTKTNRQAITVRVVVIDKGENVTGATPDDFQGKLTHAEKTSVRISGHTMQVLSVLLERLDDHGILPETEVLCALVKDPVSPIGPQWSQLANAVEMCCALNKLKPLLSGSQLPVALNMSMGTHIGPHNGESLLEELIRQLAPAGSGRYFHASAGNDGMTGCASRRELTAGISEYLKIRTGPNHCREILLEFWWREPPNGSLSITIQVASAGGQSLVISPLKINSTMAGSMQARSINNKNIICESLFHARFLNDMSCIALALSTKNSPGLPSLDLECTLSCPADVVVNAWVVVSQDPLSSFIQGHNEGTVSVPASDPEVLSVAGVEADGQPWARSSRGPASVYQGSGTAHSSTVPYMAYHVDLGQLGEFGTSFASPRACADTANIVRNRNARTRCTTIKDLVYEILALPSNPPPDWNPRTGFGAIYVMGSQIPSLKIRSVSFTIQ